MFVSLLTDGCWFHSHLLGKMRCSVLPLVVALLLLLPPVAMETQENDFKDGCQGAALLDGEHDCTWSCIIFTLQWPGGFCAVRSSALGVRVGVRASTGEDLRWFPSVCPVFVQRDPLQDPRRRHRLDHPRPVVRRLCSVCGSASAPSLDEFLFVCRPQHAQRCCSCWPMFHSDVQVSPDPVLLVSTSRRGRRSFCVSRSWRTSWRNTGRPY